MDRINTLKSAAVNHPGSFIGYGNPNSDVLILGKECAFNPEDTFPSEQILNQISYYNNAASWVKYCENPFDSSLIPDWKASMEWDWAKNFCPRFAFKGQYYTTTYCVGSTSRTWYMYQKLLDMYRGVSRSPGRFNWFSGWIKEPSLLDFQDYCFITELSDIPMLQSRTCPEVKESINSRINGLFKEPYFQSFPLVIAACGVYVKRYQINLRKLFPNSRIIVTNQLSRMPRKGYLEEIVEKMKGTEDFSIL